MRLSSKLSESAEFERGRAVGREEGRALLVQRLRKSIEALTAASFAVELAKSSNPEQAELIPRASRLLTESMELLREGVYREDGDNPQK